MCQKLTGQGETPFISQACQYCDKKYYPQQLKIHLTFWCGPDAQRSAAQAKTAIKKGQGKGKGKGKEAAESGTKRKSMEEVEAVEDSAVEDSAAEEEADEVGALVRLPRRLS